VSCFFLVIQHPALPDYQTYEYYVKNWLCLVNQKHSAQPCSTIHKQKTLMIRFFLVNQKHTMQPCIPFSKINEQEPVLLINRVLLRLKKNAQYNLEI